MISHLQKLRTVAGRILIPSFLLLNLVFGNFMKRQGLSPKQRLNDSASLGGQFCLQLAGAGLTGELHCCTLSCFVFQTRMLDTKLRSSCRHGKHFTHEPSLQPQLPLIYNYTVVCFNRQLTSLCSMKSQAGPSVLTRHEHCCSEPQGWATPQEKHCTFKRFVCL